MSDFINASKKPNPNKPTYVGKLSPFAGRARKGSMRATPAARAIQHEQSLASMARRHYKKK